MDPLAVLPPEVSWRILELLGPVDLCRCLAVSKTWRQLANSQSLWKPFCQRRSLLPLPGASGELLPLCPYAAAYLTYMRKLVRNWETSCYDSYELRKEDWCCCIACFRSLIAVYYPRASNVHLYSINANCLQPIAKIAVALPNAIAIPDVFINEDYIVLSRGNVVLIYKNGGNFELYKSIVGLDIGLVINNSIVPFVETDRRLYVKIITEKIIWLESETVYVVNMECDTYKSLYDTFRCLRFDGKYIFAANNVVSAYDVWGNKVFYLNIHNVADMWVSSEVVVCLIGNEKQSLEVWKLSTKSKVNTFNVQKDPCVSIAPENNDIFILEFMENELKLSSVSIETGSVNWTYQNHFNRELILHPELRLICDKFIFIRPSHTKDENFLLVDAKNGSVIYDSMMPPCLYPPCYIYHLSDEIFITAESSLIHIRCYV